jgi:hypothetical protein
VQEKCGKKAKFRLEVLHFDAKIIIINFVVRVDALVILVLNSAFNNALQLSSLVTISCSGKNKTYFKYDHNTRKIEISERLKLHIINYESSGVYVLNNKD